MENNCRNRIELFKFKRKLSVYFNLEIPNTMNPSLLTANARILFDKIIMLNF